MKTPSEYFNKKIIGKLTTRPIKKINIRESEEDIYRDISFEGDKIFDVIDIAEYNNEKMYVVNEWANEETQHVCCIHESFVKEYNE